jgi:hypothetical protein
VVAEPQGYSTAGESPYTISSSPASRSSQHPDNVWSLHGLHECLRRLDQHTEADMVKLRLDLANARADVPIQASCFCRLTHAA